VIEKEFDIPFIADLALREKQIQQEYRPIIAVHKWFARRPGTLFRGLLLSEFGDPPLRGSFYKKNELSHIKIADPFMGGGTPLLEANRLGCDVLGFDINPMAYWIVKQEIEHIDLKVYSESASFLRAELNKHIGHLYRTRCTICGRIDADIKYFLWVKFIMCEKCGEQIDLFPGYLIAANSRHPMNVLVCPSCGELSETDSRKHLGNCHSCQKALSLNGPAKHNRCECKHCGNINEYPKSSLGAPSHRLFALEYHCASCRTSRSGRFFKAPESGDHEKYYEAERRLAGLSSPFIPDDEIPTGDETNRLLRWGYRRYKEMFNARQLFGLALSADLISQVSDIRIREALATNLSDLLRYQNMLCRYDTVALKSLDIFSVHGFPVGLVQCESNLLGIVDPRRNKCIGSGGWANIIGKYRRAKTYCDRPFEIKHFDRGKQVVFIHGEWIGDGRAEGEAERGRGIDLRCENSAVTNIPRESLDGVFTDPPYFQNVQYAELMDFCYVWLRRLVGFGRPEFALPSTRSPHELTGNEDMKRGLEHFANGLSSVFRRMADALKPGSPLVFTYHHNDICAYFPVAVAILDAGLTCSASFPCPAEMGASIHISGTGSSIIDTVFVCRKTGSFPKRWLADSPLALAQIVSGDLELLKAGNVIPTQGDIKCIVYGHLIRHAIWGLRQVWKKDEDLVTRLMKVPSWIDRFGGWPIIEGYLKTAIPLNLHGPLFAVRDSTTTYGEVEDEISF